MRRFVARALFLAAPVVGFALPQAGRIQALPADYVAMVETYRAGDPNGALATLARWDDARTRAQVDLFKRAVVTVRSCAACPERAAFTAFPLRAAILLHADREIQQTLLTPMSEQRPECGSGPHSLAVEHLAAIEALVNPDAGLFLRRLYLALSRQALWSHCLDEADTWARAGLRLYPKDAALKVALGMAAEKVALFTLRPAPPTLASGVKGAQQSAQAIARIDTSREKARQAFEEALGLDGSLVEARLRLGRVQWQMGSVDKARATLERTLTDARTDETSYLAHLFLGRVLEETAALDESEKHYRAALSLRPRSETAAVALSHVRFLKGDVADARQTLLASLQSQGPRSDFDPWLTYSADQENFGETLLAALRSELK